MGEFKRDATLELINKLKQEPLFKDKILPDIKKGKVFLTIRNNKIDFYHYNSRLFEYDGEFKTHPKFAFVPVKYPNRYVTDEKKVGEVADFYTGYDNIKERARLYTSVEAEGIHKICKKGSIFEISKQNEYIVLDIEIAFTKNNEEEQLKGTIEQLNEDVKSQNRVDILLYNIKEQELLFVEAKHFTNKEIRAEETPAVINQIERYNEIIQNNYDIILQEYSKHIQALNNIFRDELKTELPEPKTLCKKCGLIIFGFDNDQKNGYLESNIKSKLEDTGIKIYARGNVSEIDIKTLYNSLK